MDTVGRVVVEGDASLDAPHPASALVATTIIAAVNTVWIARPHIWFPLGIRAMQARA